MSCFPAPDPARPNVVLIVVDTLRADRLQGVAEDRDTLGPVAALAAQSTRYDAAYAPASWTRPSVATVFTGMLPARHQAKIGGTSKLSTALPTLAEQLSGAGWATAGYSANVVVSRASGFDQGFERFLDYEGGVQAYPDIEIMMRQARAWLHTAPSPFFLYLQPMNAHGPYRVPAPYRKVLLGRAPSDEFDYEKPPRTTLMAGRLAERERIGESYVASLCDQYDTAVRYSMEMVGGLFSDLKRLGLWESSLVILTSDHGEEIYDHGGFSHAYTLFEEVVRVPLLVKLPGQTEPAARSDRVSLADLYPTVLEVVGLPIPGHLDGRSLLAPPEPERELVFELNNPERFLGRALLSGNYKLVETVVDYQGRRDQIALYDLSADPTESLDLAASHPELAARLHERLEALFAEYASRAPDLPEEGEAELDEDTLRALGYVN
jgi:arylsulfatase A-like enzyme